MISEEITVLSKADLRTKYVAARRALSPKERSYKNAIIAEKVARFLTHLHTGLGLPLRIGAYLPFPEEVNILIPLLTHFRDTPNSLVLSLPVYRKDSETLSFVHPKDASRLPAFLEETMVAQTSVSPNSPWWEVSAPGLIRYWLVPGVAFSPSGVRLGFGRGIYDRWLAERSGLFIGLAFDVQICPSLIAAPDDVPMHAVFTEQHAYFRS